MIELMGHILSIKEATDECGGEQIEITVSIPAPRHPDNPCQYPYTRLDEFKSFHVSYQKNDIDAIVEKIERYNHNLMKYSLDRLAYDRLTLGLVTLSQEPAKEYLTDNEGALINAQEWKDAIKSESVWGEDS